MKSLDIAIGGLFLMNAAWSGSGVVQEVKIPRSELPPAVEKTVKEQSTGATIKGFTKETEHGRTFYEVELTIEGRTKDISMDTNGVIQEIEEEVQFEALPASVKEGLTKKAGSGKIIKVESLTKKGKLVAYEAQVVRDGKKLEVQVDSNGQSRPRNE
jgi:uncharacterized membrane protein YkoI